MQGFRVLALPLRLASPGTVPVAARADGAARRHCHAGRDAGEAGRRRHLHRIAGSRRVWALPRACRRKAGLVMAHNEAALAAPRPGAAPPLL